MSFKSFDNKSNQKRQKTSLLDNLQHHSWKQGADSGL
jgi:hypothetical protein